MRLLVSDLPSPVPIIPEEVPEKVVPPLESIVVEIVEKISEWLETVINLF